MRTLTERKNDRDYLDTMVTHGDITANAALLARSSSSARPWKTLLKRSPIRSLKPRREAEMLDKVEAIA